jgi:hypothetical protein
MINVRTLKALRTRENNSIVIKNGKITTYKSGYLIPIQTDSTFSESIAIDIVKKFNSKAIVEIRYNNGVFIITEMRRELTKGSSINAAEAVGASFITKNGINSLEFIR